MKVTAGDGRTWRIGRRRLPWVYRARRLGELWDWTSFGSGDWLGPLEILAVLLFILVVLPWSIVYLLVWALALLLVPFLALARAVGLASVVVVAYRLQDNELQWKARVDARVADEILSRLPAELWTYGAPRSLLAPVNHRTG